jgi:hypothetical protein
LVVPILYLGARGLQPSAVGGTRPRIPGRSATGGAGSETETDSASLQLLGLSIGWDAGPLGLPLRFLAVLLVVLILTQLFGARQDMFLLRAPQVSMALIFSAIWMGSMGVMGLILGGGSLRGAAALLTILSGFEMVHAVLERSLAIVGFYGALTLLTALAFSYLLTVQATFMTASPAQPDEETPAF